MSLPINDTSLEITPRQTQNAGSILDKINILYVTFNLGQHTEHRQCLKAEIPKSEYSTLHTLEFIKASAMQQEIGSST